MMNNKELSKLWTLQLKTCADIMEEPKEEKKILALNAGKQVAASHPQHNSPYNTPILKQRLFNSNTTFIFTAGCHRQTGVWNMYASHMQTHYNVLESCRLFMVSHLVRGTVSTIQTRANIFSICIKITLAFLFICTCKPSPYPLLSDRVCAVKVCRWEGNQATALVSLLAVTQMLLLLPSCTTNHSV